MASQSEGYIETLLALSTAHVPGETPSFGSYLRVVEHEYGWIVFVQPEGDKWCIPDWLRPIHRVAVEQGCTLILFDRDCNEEPRFQTWDW